MNPFKIIFPLFLIVVFNFSAYSQEACKVLLPEIAENYTGKCKKGLAQGKGEAKGVDHYKGRFVKGLPDGKGTYTWANGDTYIGGWEKGKRNGEGTYTFKYNDKDSVLSGIWETNQYMGPKPKAPDVTYNSGVKRYSFLKKGKVPNSIEVKIMRNGTTNNAVSNFSMTSNSGTEKGSLIQDINYPVKVSIRYSTLTTLDTMSYQVTFDFEITEPGNWLITIYN